MSEFDLKRVLIIGDVGKEYWPSGNGIACNSFQISDARSLDAKTAVIRRIESFYAKRSTVRKFFLYFFGIDPRSVYGAVVVIDTKILGDAINLSLVEEIDRSLRGIPSMIALISRGPMDPETKRRAISVGASVIVEITAMKEELADAAYAHYRGIDRNRVHVAPALGSVALAAGLVIIGQIATDFYSHAKNFGSYIEDFCVRHWKTEVFLGKPSKQATGERWEEVVIQIHPDGNYFELGEFTLKADFDGVKSRNVPKLLPSRGTVIRHSIYLLRSQNRPKRVIITLKSQSGRVEEVNLAPLLDD